MIFNPDHPAQEEIENHPDPNSGPPDLSIDPASAEHHIAIVEHHRLARGDGHLRLVERHEGLVAAPGFDRRWRSVMTMPDLCVHADETRRGSALDPVHLTRHKGASAQLGTVSDDDPVVVRVDLYNVERYVA